MKYQHCLRPNYTKLIYEKLIKKESLNPFGRKGCGRDRLLEDLVQIALLDGNNIIEVDLSCFQHNYKGFLKNVERQMSNINPGQKLLMLTQQNNSFKTLPGISTFRNEHKLGGEPFFLLCKNFDSILGHPNHEFPERFFDDLNSLTEHRTNPVSLCCLTTNSHVGMKIYYDLEKNHKTSWLELKPIDIPKLTREEIKAEMNRVLASLTLWKAEENREKIISFIVKNSKQFFALEKVVEDFYKYPSKTLYKHRIRRAQKSLRLCYPELKKRFTYSRLKTEIFDWLKALPSLVKIVNGGGKE